MPSNNQRVDVVGAFVGLYGLQVSRVAEDRVLVGHAWMAHGGTRTAARLDLKSRRSVSYLPWMDELYSKYFSFFRKWESTTEAGEKLSRQVIEIAGLLEDYNKSLNRVAADDSLVAALDERIVGMQRRLTR